MRWERGVWDGLRDGVGVRDVHCVGEVGGASEGDGVEVVARSGAVEYRVQDTQDA